MLRVHEHFYTARLIGGTLGPLVSDTVGRAALLPAYLAGDEPDLVGGVTYMLVSTSQT